jgi:hypothetical protein
MPRITLNCSQCVRPFDVWPYRLKGSVQFYSRNCKNIASLGQLPVNRVDLVGRMFGDFSRLIIRHLPSLNLVVRFDESNISVRAYRSRKWKSVTWVQLASLADDSEPVVKVCETNHGLRVLKALGAITSDEEKAAPLQ